MNSQTPSSFWKSKTFLSIVTIFVGIILVMVFYSYLFPATNDTPIASNEMVFQKASFEIEGMTCSSCESHIKHSVSQIPGIKLTQVSYKKFKALVEYDSSKTNINDITAAINSTGYKVVSSKSVDIKKNIKKASEESSYYMPDVNQAKIQEFSGKPPVKFTVLKNSLTALKNDFNNKKEKPRFITLLSASCGWCMKGAEAIRISILEDFPDEDYHLYVVWIDILRGDNFDLAKKHAQLLNDPRVSHYYDADQNFGKSVANVLGGKGKVAWDIYMFYNSGMKWEEQPPIPSSYMHQLGPLRHKWIDANYFHIGSKLIKEMHKDMASILKIKQEL